MIACLHHRIHILKLMIQGKYKHVEIIQKIINKDILKYINRKKQKILKMSAILYHLKKKGKLLYLQLINV